jgi:tetratricopeptide (TPR) repeat protein
MRARPAVRARVLPVVLGGMLAVLVGILGAGAALAAPPPGAAEAFLEGNRLYGEGDFAGAVSAYERVLDLGVSSPELQYNLANAQLKAGRLGPAVLHYRRALLENPLYESALENLAYARALTQDVKPEERARGGWHWVGWFRLGPGAAAGLLFVAVAGFFVVAGVRVLWWRHRTATLVTQGVLGALALLLAAALVFEWSQVRGADQAVIMAPEVEVRAGPGERYTVSFRLHEGTEVELLRETAGWREVKVSDRLQGWAPDTALTPL